MPPRLHYVVTDPLTAFRFLDGQPAFMARRGFDVTIVSSPGELLRATAEREGVRTAAIPMERGISPVRDLPALAGLVAEFRSARPDLVVAGTPKAGLLGTLAARVSRVPHIVYHLRGLRFETKMGAQRSLLIATERIASAAAHKIQCNGESLRRRFVEAGCAPVAKTWVPGSGTSNGVEADRFRITPERAEWARRERARLGIARTDFVVGFVGRLAKDKGLPQLIPAFRSLASAVPAARLLLVGSDDPTDPLDADQSLFLKTSANVIALGHVREPAPLYALMDVLAFPSHREGFPNVPLEAAAATVPTVGFRATGTLDAVVDGHTGTLVPVGDVAAFEAALRRYAVDGRQRLDHGTAAEMRVRTEFDRVRLWEALAKDYERILSCGAP